MDGFGNVSEATGNRQGASFPQQMGTETAKNPVDKPGLRCWFTQNLLLHRLQRSGLQVSAKLNRALVDLIYCRGLPGYIGKRKLLDNCPPKFILESC